MFVLIHGGAHSSRCWDRLVPLFDAPALAIDLPGRGAVGDIEEGNVADAVLVGHSMAGLEHPRHSRAGVGTVGPRRLRLVHGARRRRVTHLPCPRRCRRVRAGPGP